MYVRVCGRVQFRPRNRDTNRTKTWLESIVAAESNVQKLANRRAPDYRLRDIAMSVPVRVSPQAVRGLAGSRSISWR